jgi:ethanolamine permease
VSAFINLVGLLGLIASFFSIIYAYSRQTFALSRAGYLPKILSITGKQKTPVLALIVPGVIGFVLAVLNEGDLLILVAVFGATISYIMMTASHIILRFKEPDLERPYRTPGGVVTTGIAFVLACVALIAGFLVDTRVLVITAIVYAIALAYFGFYSRKHIVATAPEEEFDLIESAEDELR